MITGSVRTCFVVRYVHLLIFAFFFQSFFIAYGQQTARESPAGNKMWVYTPSSYSPSGDGSPLLVFLHGGSSIGDDLTLLTTGADHDVPSRLIHQNRWNTALPFVVVSPQLKRDPEVYEQNDQRWPDATIHEVIEYVKANYNIDASRVYLMGISLGGAACWTYAAAYPEEIAAMVPFSGTTNIGDACKLKDIPIWVFHGDTDGLVVPNFSIDMVTAIGECSPAGLYSPNLTLIPAQGHEGWNPVMNSSTGYDVYSWMLSFRKNNHVNHAPFVTAGGNRKLRTGSVAFFIAGDFFDVDGSVDEVQWTKVSGPSVNLAGQNSRILELSSISAGTYTFRLRVVDDDGSAATDEMTLEVNSFTGSPAITNLTLTDGAENVIRVLAQEDVIDLQDIGMDRINVFAYATNTGSVRFTIDAFDNIFTRGISSGRHQLKPNNQDWRVDDGRRILCAIPYSGTGGGGTEGPCSCYSLTVTRATYYAKSGADLSSLSGWGSNPDGTGAAPSTFAGPPATFVVNTNAQLNSETLINPQSRVVVKPGATLTLNHRFRNTDNTRTFTGLYAEGNSVIRVNTTAGFGFTTVASENTVYFENTSGTSLMPTGIYGSVVLRNAGQKSFPNGAVMTVRKNLVIHPNTPVLNSGQSSAEIVALGSVDIQDPVVTPSRPIAIRSAGTTPTLHTSSPVVSLQQLSVDKGSTLRITSPGDPVTIEVNTGPVIIADGATLDLNGNTLHIKGNATLNTGNQKGSINFAGGLVKFETTGGTSNLYPKRDGHATSVLDVNIGGGSLIVRDSLRITDNLRVRNGTVNSNGFITIVSGASRTAYVAAVEGTGEITGVVNVQRFYESGKKYKYMAVPLSGVKIKQIQPYIPVTGAFPQSSTGPGLSKTPSMYYYSDQEGGWVAYPKSSNEEVFQPGKGYSIYVRDAVKGRAVSLAGELIVGDFSFPLNPDPDPGKESDGWNLIGNPYAAPIQWGGAGWQVSGLNQAIYIRENDSESGTGRFLMYSGGVGDFDGVISSGQSFWIRAISSNPSLTISESAKRNDGDVEFYRTGSTPVSWLGLKLAHGNLEDNTYLKFSEIGKPALDNERDAVKQRNDYFNISVRTSDGVSVALKNVSDTLCIHEVGLNFEPDRQGSYSLSLRGTAIENGETVVKLRDIFADSTAVLNGETAYTFAVTSDEKSGASDRFNLWIETKEVPDPHITFSDGTLHSDAEKGNQWLFNGAVIEGATGPSFLPSQEGEYQVRVSKGGCVKESATYAYRITGISPLIGEWQIHPNPARDEVRLTGITGHSGRYAINSVTGAFIQSGDIDSDNPAIDVRNLSPGAYLLRVDVESRVAFFRLFIQ